MRTIGHALAWPSRRPYRNRPDTDFGSGGHIIQPWPSDPVDYKPSLRHGLKLVCWNMDWLADLFAEDQDGGDVLKPDDMVVRGPSVPHQPGSGPTVAHRVRLFRKALADLDPDVILVLEGPATSEALQHFLRMLGHGDWECRVQRSRYPATPGGPLREARRCIGLAVRVDTGRFESAPVEMFDAEEPASGPVHAASEPFFATWGSTSTTEWHHFQTRPLYAELYPSAGASFRILGVHLKSRGFFAGYEWSRWLLEAEATRVRFAALARRLRQEFLDRYLTDPLTRRTPLVVAGGLNEGAGARVFDARGQLCAAEMLMGSVWAPHLSLGNALFDAAGGDHVAPATFDGLWTMRFPDPISERVHHKAWVDHVLYTRNAPEGWCAGAVIPRATLGGIPYETISDHFPVSVRIDTSGAASPVP